MRRVSKDGKSVQISVRVPITTLEEIDGLAARTPLTRSQIVVGLLRGIFDRNIIDRLMRAPADGR